MSNLSNLDISNNPIDIIRKPLCLLECLLMSDFKPKVNEKLVVGYLNARYDYVPKVQPQRPQTA